ncbi:hypothetical protein ACEV8X_03290 [Vibrio parahaemolyticus]|uniref:hypothetical protein n=1 Tax=Vibrio sp. dhg TaxID=2163016 RepID=UPI0013C3004A|nr:hypothetical protein [Vibrio sp. dhg]HCH3850175.1 hypothetical protein [Vibrio parahaemolyticus]
MTKLLDSLVGDNVSKLSHIPISSVHWIRYVPAILVGILVSILLFYLCKNLKAAVYTKCLTYIASSFVVIGVFLSGSWYKDPVYTLILPEDDYYTAEKTNFVSSNGTIVAWSDECNQSGRVIYCYVSLKNVSEKDQEVSVDIGNTYIVTGEKAHVRVDNLGKLGNQAQSALYRKVTAPKNMTIIYGLKFELPEPTAFDIIPNLRVSMKIAGYLDTFSMSNRPIKSISGHK